ncbi:MAG: nuclear transport factor 2 family protein [Deltaproteobacteria bacterium]|nr:nuclear transport factor 2 family protein [Deltaproteobacteria bacterium]
MATKKKGKKKAGKAKAKSDKKAKKKAGSPKAKSAAPKQVKTGKGASPLEVGNDLVKLVRSGKGDEVYAKWWAPGVVSVEGLGMSMEWSGRKSVLQKNATWEADHVVHGAEVEGPFVGATGFSVRFKMGIETKSTGQRESMEEIGVYTVKNGKIVREEFMYRAG